MNTQQCCNVMTAKINFQFGYCPLLWMFHSTMLNNRIVYNNNNLIYEELLQKDPYVLSIIILT